MVTLELEEVANDLLQRYHWHPALIGVRVQDGKIELLLRSAEDATRILPALAEYQDIGIKFIFRKV